MLYVNGRAAKKLFDICALVGCQVHDKMWLML